MIHEGQRLGEFEILEQIGRGGMGAVYKAEQTALRRFVAIKTLQPALASDAEYVARFHNEAVAAAGLNHPNLVQVHAAGEADGLHWFAMEFVEGESAQDRVKRKGRIQPGEAIAIAMNVATALDYGWRKAQLIHRDIKPDNIFLSSDGEVKLGDLGLAKSVSQQQAGLTTTGASMGTPHYISPEQAEGKRDVDLRTDIYSLGCTLFHLLSGKPPYAGESAVSVMMKHVSAPVPDLRSVWPECPPALAAVVAKAMQKSPDARQQSYEELSADLRRAYAVLNAPLSAQGKSRGLLYAGLAAGIVASICAFVFFTGKKPKQGDVGGPSVKPAATTLAQGIKPAAAISTEGWTNLLANVDVKRGSLMAPWTLEKGALRSPQRNASDDEDAPGSHQTFVFPVPNPPRNYNLRYRITRNMRGFAICMPFARGGESGDLRIDGGHGFRLAEKGREKTGKSKQEKLWLPVGELHEVLIEVRENRVRISLDGALQIEHPGSLPDGRHEAAFFPPGKVKMPLFGIGVCGGDITVHSAALREVDKDGKPVAKGQ